MSPEMAAWMSTPEYVGESQTLSLNDSKAKTAAWARRTMWDLATSGEAAPCRSNAATRAMRRFVLSFTIIDCVERPSLGKGHSPLLAIPAKFATCTADGSKRLLPPHSAHTWRARSSTAAHCNLTIAVALPSSPALSFPALSAANPDACSQARKHRLQTGEPALAADRADVALLLELCCEVLASPLPLAAMLCSIVPREHLESMRMYFPGRIQSEASLNCNAEPSPRSARD
mmetsp:Transcript_73255/g.174574  ORF Transcript_73255/g.174574 Transcript_73255/m.174574 type:complete len:231 (-) Transcript_73255:308-1000(-)